MRVSCFLFLIVLLGCTAAFGAWAEQAKLTASDAAEADSFGGSVSLNGDRALVGAQLGDDDPDTDTGAAYVFVRTGAVWTEEAKLTAGEPSVDPADQLGRSVSLDGDTALVGAPLDDDRGLDSGSAYIFVRSGGVWTEQAKLTASDAAGRDRFGNSVSLDGDTALVGAPADDDAGTDSGSAYLFVRSGGVWTEQAKLTAGDAAAGDSFGASVSLDGDTALVGAEADADAGRESGSAYIFVRSGAVWTEQAKLTVSDAARLDRFGSSVSLDSDTALVGAYRDDDAGSNSGSAYIFVRSAGVWTEQAKLAASDGAADDLFAFSVSLDADTVLVGAFWHDDAGPNSGSAYIYTGCLDDTIPPDQGNVIRATKSGTDVVLDFTGAPASVWRVNRDGDKTSIGMTELPTDVGVTAFTDSGALPITAGHKCAIYRILIH